MGNRGKSKNWEIKKKSKKWEIKGNKSKRGYELACLRMKKKEVEKNKLGSIRNGVLRVKKKKKTERKQGENKVSIKVK